MNTFEGFVGFLIANLTYGLTYLTVTATIASFFVCTELYLEAFHRHYALLIRNVDDVVLVNKGMVSIRDARIQMKSQLFAAVNVHNEAKG